MRDLLTSLLATLFEHGIPVDGMAVKAAAALPREQAQEYLELLFTLGWGINTALSNSEPPVLGAALHHISLTRCLLQNGADPNAGCDIDETPLSVAVNSSTIPTVDLLLQYAQPGHNGHLVYHATQRADLDEAIKIIKLLHDHNKPVDDVLYQDPRSCRLKLHFYEELHYIMHAKTTKFLSLSRFSSSVLIQTSLA